MIRALRRVSAERGVDPAELTLCSFGGAGGLHACRLADGLGMRAVLVPPNPGILSATGMLLADWIMDFSATLPGGCFVRSGDGDAKLPDALRILRRAFSGLMDRAAHAVQLEGYEQDDSLLERSVDMRYRGQAHELTVPLESLGDVDRLLEPFHAEHGRRFGHAVPDEPVQLVTARIRAVVATEKPDVPDAPVSGRSIDEARIYTRDILFDDVTPTAVFDRERFEPGHELHGPALIVEPYATTLVPPGWSACVEPTLALRLTRRGSGT
jgi:N-methylhydantoinase A